MLGVAGLIMAAPSQLLYPMLPTPKGLEVFNHIRAISAYDITIDQYLLRYDILYRPRGKKLTQIHIGMRVPPNIERYSPEDYIKRLHKPMVAILNNHLRKHGVLRSELMRLPVPDYYTEPEWLTKMLLEVKF